MPKLRASSNFTANKYPLGEKVNTGKNAPPAPGSPGRVKRSTTKKATRRSR